MWGDTDDGTRLHMWEHNQTFAQIFSWREEPHSFEPVSTKGYLCSPLRKDYVIDIKDGEIVMNKKDKSSKSQLWELKDNYIFNDKCPADVLSVNCNKGNAYEVGSV
jgi:hypothetical protein